MLDRGFVGNIASNFERAASGRLDLLAGGANEIGAAPSAYDVSAGDRHKALVVPTAQTRMPARAGELTRYAWNYYGKSFAAVLPALGTHKPMSSNRIHAMFGNVPQDLFHPHNWREDVETIGTVPGKFISEQSEGKLDYEWPAQVHRLVLRGGFDLILSIGQVVPHEVI